MIIAIILSSLALLAAMTTMGLVLMERKRNQKRNTAMTQYVDTGTRGIMERIKKISGEDEFLANRISEISFDVSQLTSRVAELEGGTVPDYEKAKAAAKAVNDFHAGISDIFGFDPYDALKRSREKDGEQI